MFGLFCGQSIHIITVYVHTHVQITDKHFFFLTVSAKQKQTTKEINYANHTFLEVHFIQLLSSQNQIYIYIYHSKGFLFAG